MTTLLVLCAFGLWRLALEMSNSANSREFRSSLPVQRTVESYHKDNTESKKVEESEDDSNHTFSIPADIQERIDKDAQSIMEQMVNQAFSRMLKQNEAILDAFRQGKKSSPLLGDNKTDSESNNR